MGSMSVAMALASGQSGKAGKSQKAGTSADVRDVAEFRHRQARACRAQKGTRRSSHAGRCRKRGRRRSRSGSLPGPNACRCGGVWTKKRPARMGTRPAWLIVTQSASPSCSTRGSPLPRWARILQILALGFLIEISVDQPFVGLQFIRLVGDNNSRMVAVARQLAHRADGLALRTRARNRDAPAQWAAVSLASRSSSCVVIEAA